MKCQSLFSGKDKKYIIKLLYANFAHSMINVKEYSGICWCKGNKIFV